MKIRYLTLGLLAAGWLAGSAVADTRPTLQSLQDQINVLKAQVAALELPVITAQVADGLLLADGPKTAVAEFYVTRGFMPATNTDVGIVDPITDNNVTQVVIANGRIDITYGNQANPAIFGKVLSLTPYIDQSSYVVLWRCGNAPAPSNAQLPPSTVYLPTLIDNIYLPSGCRL